MKKKGYTLIEMIVSMSIIIIITITFLSVNNFEKRILCKMENYYTASEIQSFLTFSKIWCKKNDTPATIIIDTKEKKIYLRSNFWTTIKTTKFPSNSKVLLKNNMLEIPVSRTGRINKSFTIKFKDNFNNNVSIAVTVSVGVDKIGVKYIEE